jgi:hypothetical protein
MATIFKTLTNNDRTSTRTLLHESIPVTGTILSGTYGGSTIALGSEPNIKNYSHGMFQSVYDYPYLSSSANQIFDITLGYSTGSSLSSSTNVQNAKKINIYNQMAGVLQGHDASGNILQFDQDGDVTSGGTKLKECVFLNFSRLLTKDEIKKGSFSLKLGASASYASASVGSEFQDLLTITDSKATGSYLVNSPTGEYSVLYGSGSTMGADTKVGLLFYQAGVAVLTGGIFQTYGKSGAGASGSMVMLGLGANTGSTTGPNMNAQLTGSSISASCDAIRHRIYNVSFNNTTELNSSVYFCRVNNNEFNYSANPTYLSSSKIRVKNNQLDAPVSYFTTVGLYSPDNELLAVAKVSEPLKKDPSNEMTIRVRLDY